MSCRIVDELMRATSGCVDSLGSTVLSQPWPAAIQRLAKRASAGARPGDSQGASRRNGRGNT
jgi:hypothetical protein